MAKFTIEFHLFGNFFFRRAWQIRPLFALHASYVRLARGTFPQLMCFRAARRAKQMKSKKSHGFSENE